MTNHKNRKEALDANTKRYIGQMKIYQLLILFVIVASFLIFARVIVSSNEQNLREVALEEVRESMRETVNNIAIHVDTVRERMDVEATAYITDISNRMLMGGVSSVEDILEYLKVCDENELGQAVEVLYTLQDGTVYYINRYQRDVLLVQGPKIILHKDSAVENVIHIDGQEILIYIRQAEVDGFVKEEIHDYLHLQTYDGNQYVWVNEVVNKGGGPYYAIRRIHPNLVESEGEYLSTYIMDEQGARPYQNELDGINQDGYVFHSYYFKNKTDDKVMEKFSYAQYYEPYNWIIATGETIEEVYNYSNIINAQNVKQIFTLLGIFVVLFIIVSGMMIRVLEKQAKEYRGQMLKQTEIIEDIYATMSAGLLRLRMTESDMTVIKVNPMGLELLGAETEAELSFKIHGHSILTIDSREESIHVKECQKLKEKWESIVTECHVTHKDGSTHLLRIRDTLVEIDEDAKIIQRMYQDITEEYNKQQEELLKAEEKATLDPMTQIKNKKAIEMEVRAQITEAAQTNRPIAVGFVDIDNFRDYNTKYGHMQGDEVIKYVAATVQEYIPGIVGRNGGDEFAFVIPDATYDKVEAAMKVIYIKLNMGIKIKDTREQVATPCSIGVVLTQGNALNYDEIMEQSDAAMYEAKARGKNTYYIYMAKETA